MTQTTIPAALPETPPADDPFRYGWRFVPRPTPEDPHHLEQVPLTLEDVLHPEVGDFIARNDGHETDRMYLTEVLRARLEESGAAIALSDVRIAWDVPDLRPHGPDVTVIPGVRERRNWSTFEVAVEGARPALIIDITSPETRANDLERKVAHYARAGVAQYVIVDDVGRGRWERRLRLLNYRLEGGAYRVHPPDANGRVHLVIANLWLGVEGDHVVCSDEQGVAFGNYAPVVRQAAERAQREAERAQREAKRAQREAERARREAAAREAEARARREAGERAREAEARARREAKRAQREAERARREAEARAARSRGTGAAGSAGARRRRGARARARRGTTPVARRLVAQMTVTWAIV
jgi:Uma2 family endonuclease